MDIRGLYTKDDMSAKGVNVFEMPSRRELHRMFCVVARSPSPSPSFNLEVEAGLLLGLGLCQFCVFFGCGTGWQDELWAVSGAG